MELFLELTRNCNMACSHCLRGEAQNKYMPDHILFTALQLSEGYIGIGGGEPLASSKLMHKLWNALLCTHTDVDTLFLVTNGLGICKNPKILETLARVTTEEIHLSVSTDRWHDPGAKERYNNVHCEAAMYDNITVSTHGPRNRDNLVIMGRSHGGTDLKLEASEDDELRMYYVDIHGNVWALCDLSYTFMSKFKNSMLCFGNVLTHTPAQIEENKDKLYEFILERGTIYVTEDFIPEEIELNQEIFI